MNHKPKYFIDNLGDLYGIIKRSSLLLIARITVDNESEGECFGDGRQTKCNSMNSDRFTVILDPFKFISLLLPQLTYAYYKAYGE